MPLFLLDVVFSLFNIVLFPVSPPSLSLARTARKLLNSLLVQLLRLYALPLPSLPLPSALLLNPASLLSLSSRSTLSIHSGFSASTFSFACESLRRMSERREVREVTFGREEEERRTVRAASG